MHAIYKQILALKMRTVYLNKISTIVDNNDPRQLSNSPAYESTFDKWHYGPYTVQV